MFPLMQKAGYKTGVFGKVVVCLSQLSRLSSLITVTKVTNDQGKILDEAIKLGTMDYIDSPIDYNNFNGVTWQRRFANGTNYVENIQSAWPLHSHWLDPHRLHRTNPIFGTTYQTTQIGNRTLRSVPAHPH